MLKKRILIVSDNERVMRIFMDIIANKKLLKDGRLVEYVCSPRNTDLAGTKVGDHMIEAVNIKENYEEITKKYDLVISAHCKQLFPAQMTKNVTCINIHPGLNPFNRGWYPQVFSILNGLPLGATIHEIDEAIDHGAIIDQLEVKVNPDDTSIRAYDKVIEAEKEIINRSIESIFNDTYTTNLPGSEGNLNLKKDFDALCEINLTEMVTFQQAIDRLRALTHGDYKNAYFYDEKTKQKIYVSIDLEISN